MLLFYNLCFVHLASFNKYIMEEQIKNCRIILGDNMEYMKNIPDKYYGLCVVDPPYGLGIDGQKKGTSKNPKHNRKEHSKKIGIVQYHLKNILKNCFVYQRIR